MTLLQTVSESSMRQEIRLTSTSVSQNPYRLKCDEICWPQKAVSLFKSCGKHVRHKMCSVVDSISLRLVLMALAAKVGEISS